MSKMKLSELRGLIREELIKTIVAELDTKDMANGSSWKTTGTGWAAKNANGVTNYWYGKDAEKNKKSAESWSKDTSKKSSDLSSAKK